MLLLGPPQIVTVLPPFFWNEPLSVGWRARIGTGETTATMAAVAVARSLDVDGPTNRISPVCTVREIVTRRRLTGSDASVTPGAGVLNSTNTVSSEPPPNPLLRAYTHGVVVSVVVHV